MQDLTIALAQSDLVWENAQANVAHFDELLSNLNQDVDLIILPEVFNTGFPVDPEKFAETLDGPSVNWMKEKAAELDCTIAGSLLLKKSRRFFNTLISINADGTYDEYSKRHVFHLGDEADTISPGTERIIIQLKGWKIRPMVCYDLRFPVWSKNTYTNNTFEYDMLFYVANWPAVRSYPWKQMLISRAIENQSYVVGVNRIGKDGTGNNYSGDSMLIDPKGQIQKMLKPNHEELAIVKLSMKDLTSFRNKFNVGPDWDKFTIE